MMSSVPSFDLDGDVDGRVILHFDLDAFYVACERELNPDLRGAAVAVSQYNPYGKLVPRASEQFRERIVAAPTIPRGNEDSNGSLIAVSYESRAKGVKRNQRGKEALQKCPDLTIVQVPTKHGKADLTMYRNASRRVMECLQEKLKNSESESPSMEIASIDEVYIDVTEQARSMAQELSERRECWPEIRELASQCTTVGGVEVLSKAAEAANALGKEELRRGSAHQVTDSSAEVDPGSLAWWGRPLVQWTPLELRLACGAYLAGSARRAVRDNFDGGVFTLSAGISSNKTLAKLASGLKKPNRQTLVNRCDEHGALEKLFHPLPLGRIRGLGGKLGNDIGSRLGINTVGQLALTPLPTLRETVDAKMATFLFDISRGICRDPITPRTMSKSVGCSKTFRGHLGISVKDTQKLDHWVDELCGELVERLEEDQGVHNRRATRLVATVKLSSQASQSSKQARAPTVLTDYGEVAKQLTKQLVELCKNKVKMGGLNISLLGLSATNFVDLSATPVVSALGDASQNGATAPSPKKPPKRKRPTGMDAWLSSSKSASKKIQKHQKESGTGCMATRIKSSPSTKSATSRQPSAAAHPSKEGVDPEVLAQLPEEPRKDLLRDLERSQKHQRKSGSIQAFFQRRV